MSGRECSFASDLSCSSTGSTTPNSSTISDSDKPLPTIPQPLTAPSTPPPIIQDTINPNHVDLILHLTSERGKDMFNLATQYGPYNDNITLGLRIGIEHPYLLHVLLAFASRHLAFLNPQRRKHYLDQAVSLQTRAVSLFNSRFSHVLLAGKVDQNNCVPVLVFSSVLGNHLLADALLSSTRSSTCQKGADSSCSPLIDPVEEGSCLDLFLDRYVQCTTVHRGIYTIATTAWSLLMQSDIAPILVCSLRVTSRVPTGSQCNLLWELIDISTSLSEEEKEGCRRSIKYLQVGLDALLAERSGTGKEEEEEERERQNGNERYQMVFSWTFLVPPEVTAMLAAKRPEALVLLGWYALLLHYARDMWQVGGAGRYILRALLENLAPDWHCWLEHPREVMGL